MMSTPASSSIARTRRLPSSTSKVPTPSTSTSGTRQQHLAQSERVRGPVESFHHPHVGPLLRGLRLGHHCLPVREYRRVGVRLGPLCKLLDDRFDPPVEVAP